ncbi:hypothetical protein [Hymenobacter volaticus]|uniref:Uncharacterized protein n=1 Tax=Hymenobacter volaticus TaxID=2932254 RepID=A0ABY4G5P5_9BACT|nr:hypothetical protein [Hymenobacter volaticus]UOQ66224.1 hypothetical protein MUN86_22475 [Hymenobacter volaticus]
MRSSLFRSVPVAALFFLGVACQRNVVVTTPTDTPATGNTGSVSTPAPTSQNTTTPCPMAPWCSLILLPGPAG